MVGPQDESLNILALGVSGYYLAFTLAAKLVVKGIISEVEFSEMLTEAISAIQAMGLPKPLADSAVSDLRLQFAALKRIS